MAWRRRIRPMETPSPDPLSGRTLHERYSLGERVRSDASGTVYSARDLPNDRAVTVTVMHPWLSRNHAAVHAFLGRAQTLAAIPHPGIAPVLGHGRDENHVYSVTEYASGETLAEVLGGADDGLRYSQHTALSIVVDVLTALDATHQAGIVHGELGTDQVILADDGQVRITGFPLLFDAEEDAGPDTRTDVHSVGALLYTLLTGSPAGSGGDLPLRPSLSVPGLTPDLDMLVGNATDPNPRYRPRDARQYLTLVEQVLRSLPRPPEEGEAPRSLPVVAGTPTGAGPQHTNRRPLWRRVPVITAVGVLMALVLFVAGWAAVSDVGTELPDFVGGDPEAAERELEALDLDLVVSLDHAYSDSVDQGHIADTTPDPGAVLEEGAEVLLWLSDGPQVVDVPDVAGEAENDARNSLREAGFGDIDVVQEHSAEEEPGTVLSTEPEAGEAGDREEEVTLHVSEGVIVPDLIGMERSDADDALDSLDLGAEAVEIHHDTVPESEVLGQDPEPGSILPDDGSVTFTVSIGPEEVEEEVEEEESAEEETETGDQEEEREGDRGDHDRGGSCDAEAWDHRTVYDEGDRVHFRGRVYEAQWYIQSLPPPAAEEWGAWVEVGRC